MSPKPCRSCRALVTLCRRALVAVVLVAVALVAVILTLVVLLMSLCRQALVALVLSIFVLLLLLLLSGPFCTGPCTCPWSCCPSVAKPLSLLRSPCLPLVPLLPSPFHLCSGLALVSLSLSLSLFLSLSPLKMMAAQALLHELGSHEDQPQARALPVQPGSDTMSGTPVLAGSDEPQRTKAVKAAQVLEQAGVDFSDPAGWLAATEIIETGSEHQHRPGKCGELLVSYQQVRDTEVAVLLARTNQLLADYHKRLEMIESFVYMHCVGIQLEKHYRQPDAT